MVQDLRLIVEPDLAVEEREDLDRVVLRVDQEVEALAVAEAVEVELGVSKCNK